MQDGNLKTTFRNMRQERSLNVRNVGKNFTLSGDLINTLEYTAKSTRNFVIILIMIKYAHSKKLAVNFDMKLLLVANVLCQFRHAASDETKPVESNEHSMNKASKEEILENMHEKHEQLEEALAKIESLEVNKTVIEKKLKIYSATIKKMANERKNI